jgi:hypothetical protein
MTLGDWQRSRHLIEHAPSRQEIQGLMRGAAQDIGDSKVPGLSAGGRFSFAYNAALRMATAALAASGYRASRVQHHFRVIHSPAFTIEADPSLVDLLDRFRKKRNMSMYEHPGMISEYEADEMVTVAVRLRSTIESWLHRNHPKLS